jgi:hypothetical protein
MLSVANTGVSAVKQKKYCTFNCPTCSLTNSNRAEAKDRWQKPSNLHNAFMRSGAMREGRGQTNLSLSPFTTERESDATFSPPWSSPLVFERRDSFGGSSDAYLRTSVQKKSENWCSQKLRHVSLESRDKCRIIRKTYTFNHSKELLHAACTPPNESAHLRVSS